MIKVEKKEKMLEFRPITPYDKALYDSKFSDGFERGCEFSFANLYLWGRQSMVVLDGQILLFSQFDRRSVYPFPVGSGDKRKALDAIIADSQARGIPCRISGISDEGKRLIRNLYGDKFRFHCDEGSFDYVYSIDDLADLKGKKYHGKRNHINRFKADYPDFKVVPLNGDNLTDAKKLVDEWYEIKLNENPDGDFHMEKAAIKKAFRDFDALQMEGIALYVGERAVAVTLASRLNFDTFDVHFEKAASDINGAYAMINNSFAKYIREKYPEVNFLNREEDMGLDGLRRAKQSYYPHHMVKKCWACKLEEGYDY